MVRCSTLISELRPLVRDIGDATLIVPLIKEYLEIGVKNDEQLIKMATIVQRVLQNIGEDGGLGITEEEKDQLIAEMEKLQDRKKSQSRVCGRITSQSPIPLLRTESGRRRL